MKTWMWTGAGVGLLMAAGVAVAQVPPTGAPPPPPPGGEMQNRPHGPMGGPMGGPMEGMHGPMDAMHRRMGWMMHHMDWHRPPPSKAAHFRFKKGDALVDIKCADDEPMKACVDAGSALLDKLMAAPK